ncbi:hypothetical protein ACFHYQ_21045 [Sphaerimonospora cavernae]|uniref:Halobacterial output domain-containing protein n=1 Tax=Sphaerimonospora cavernae TaxID=1740611 RepID=A0ABV6U9D2_9ACTN
MTAHVEDDTALTDTVLDALARREIVESDADPAVRLLSDPAVRLLKALVADVDEAGGAADYRLSSVSITPST